MKIESIKAAFPSRKVTNQDILDLVRTNSASTFDGDLNRAIKRIHHYLTLSGAEDRFWLNAGEKPIDFILAASRDALSEAGYDPKDIELLVYVGVDRGFQEPGNSYFIANALSMNSAHCFDILDACMSWSRALQMIHALFSTGDYKRAMIVNGEFNQTHPDGPAYPRTFSIKGAEDIEWKWPGYTVGEAATATILSFDRDRKWTFCFSSKNNLAGLCNIPLKGFEGYSQPAQFIGQNDPNCFTSFGSEMHKAGTPEVIDVYRKLVLPTHEIKAIFPHTSSKKAWDDAADVLGVRHLLYHIYPRYGNLVSASVPSAIALAVAEGHVTRDDHVVGWVGSAGMSFAAYSFSY